MWWPSTASPTDTEAELKLVEDKCRALGVNVALSEVWAKGGEGGIALAEEVIRLCEAENHFRFSYELEQPIEDKLAAIVKKVYHGDGVVLTPAAKKQVKQLTGWAMAICPSAWPRPSIPSPMTRAFWAPPTVLPSQSGM